MDIDSLISVCYSLHNERQEVLKTLRTDEEIQKWQKDTLSFFRNQIEPYVFNYLNYTHGHKLDEFWKTNHFSKKYKYAFVIVERRVHPNWWFILRNILWAAPQFSLYIFCSDINYDFIKSLLGDKAENVHICKWFKGIADKENGYMESNVTFKLAGFYRLIDAEYCITVQMDSYFLQKIPDLIFTGAYYGAPWGWNPTMAGNGGLSVRNIKSMIEMCEKAIEKVNTTDGEDGFFSEAIKKYNYDFPPYEFRVNIFQENFPIDTIPIGVHQFWTFINNFNLSDITFFTNHINKSVTLIGL